MRYTYLLVDLLTISVPLIFSFHPRIKFINLWKAFIPALIITGIIFVLWDVYFTRIGVWSFNENYLTGIKLINLPVEEVLFFLCIPFACLFTYYCISLWRKNNTERRLNFPVTLILLLLATGIFYYNRLYTSVTLISLAIFLTFVIFVIRETWINNFFFASLFLIIPFVICNGILTGTGLDDAIVKYDDTENMGLRILTIPIEDFFYGMLMIGMNVYLFERFRRQKGSVGAN